MLNGLYGYIFGSTSSANDEITVAGNDVQASSDNEIVKPKQDGDWIMVEKESSLKRKPSEIEMMPRGVLDECESISSISEYEASTITNKNSDSAKREADISKLNKEQEKKASLSVHEQRKWLTKMLFADPNNETFSAAISLPPETNYETSPSNKLSDKKLKRASKNEVVQSQPKTKQRSKKSAKVNSNRNNDRKCNPHNID